VDRKYSDRVLRILRDLHRGGIALDGDVLDGIRSSSRALSVCQTGSPNENCVFDLDSGGTGYLLSIAIQNETARTIWLQEFRLGVLWHDPQFSWLSEAPRTSSRAQTYSFPPPGPVGLDREVVLNHRVGTSGRLNPGGTIEGLLLGIGEASMPTEYRDRQQIRLRLEIFDRQGGCSSRVLDLGVSRRNVRARRLANI